MPVNTNDQGIPLPVGADSADNPVAFTNNTAQIEQRLVRNYLTEADRTARMLVLGENDVSTLDAEDRADIYNGTTHVSLYQRAVFSAPRLTANFNLALSSTALQSVTGMASAMPTAGTFYFRGTLFYSSSTTADIKFAFLLPAGATVLWTGNGVVVGGTGTGDATFSTIAASDATLSYGGNGVGAILACHIQGTYVAGGTAGNLQLRAAQNTVDATQSTIHTHTRLEVWRAL